MEKKTFVAGQEYKLSDLTGFTGKVGQYTDKEFAKMGYKQRLQLKQTNSNEYDRLTGRERCK